MFILFLISVEPCPARWERMQDLESELKLNHGWSHSSPMSWVTAFTSESIFSHVKQKSSSQPQKDVVGIKDLRVCCAQQIVTSQEMVI